MNISNMLDRMEDRIFEAIKSWNSGGQSKETLLFDLDLVEKDIEQIKNLLALELRQEKEIR